MSGTTRALDLGFAQPVAVPAAIDWFAAPLCPLQLRLVLDRTLQPVSAMLGAPPKFMPVSASPWPPSSVRMHEASGLLVMAEEAAATPIEFIAKIAMKLVGTVPFTLALYPPLPSVWNVGVA